MFPVNVLHFTFIDSLSPMPHLQFLTLYYLVNICLTYGKCLKFSSIFSMLFFGPYYEFFMPLFLKNLSGMAKKADSGQSVPSVTF